MSSPARVLVVGGGHNGLMAGVHLAMGGCEVTVLEHAPRIGGATSSSALTLPGFVHDHCAGFLPMTAVSPAFQELGLEADGLELIRAPAVMAHPFADGSAIVLHHSLEETVEAIERVAPGAGRGWRDLAEPLLPRAGVLARAVLDPLPPVAPALRLAAAMRRDAVGLARGMIASAHALGLEAFAGAERPTAWLGSTAMHTALPTTAAVSGGFALLLQLLAHTHGWPVARGGTQAVADALLSRLRAYGGEVRCGAHVERILVRRGRVAGIRLSDGDEIAADAVLTTVSARVLARMLPEDALPARLLRRLRIWRHDAGAFKLDYALSGPVPWTAPEARSTPVVQVAGELDDLVGAMQAVLRGRVPEAPALIVGQQSLSDPTRAPAGQHTLYVYAHVPTRPDVGDAEITDRIERRLDAFAPGWRELVLARHVRPLAETEREDPSLIRGDLGGGSYQLDQQLVFRPAPELCRYRTPLRGLYIAGASVHPGGAVHGMSGRSAARALLADRRRRPWRLSASG